MDLLETESSNCGNNVTNTIALLDRHGLARERVLLIQDATMQRRMSAVWQHHDPHARVTNYASYTAPVGVLDGTLEFLDPPQGMWALPRFGSMLLGEVSRLRDDAHGYGPRGRGYLAHVDVPSEVETAAALLANTGMFESRAADPRWS